MTFFNEANVYRKLSAFDASLEQALLNPMPISQQQPARDLKVVMADELPPKRGLSFTDGQARLLHDLASIELQALELCLRTLNEFPEAPTEFREQLADIALSESKHLRLCLEGLDQLGFAWGSWPVHMALWNSTSASDSLLDRITIVHRYLEGSGLDAGETLLRRLAGVSEGAIHRATRVIFAEEVEHVLFGSRWYFALCKQEGLDPEIDFPLRLRKIQGKVPKRIEKISWKARRQAGFTDGELKSLEELRNSIVKFR